MSTTPPEQRATFQPAGVAVFAMTAASLGEPTWSAPTRYGCSCWAAGLGARHRIGLKLFGKLDDQAFRRIVLILLLLSGLSLLVLGR